MKGQDRLKSIKRLEDGWHDGDGLAPSQAAIDWVEDFLSSEWISDEIKDQLHSFPTISGGISIECQINSSRWNLEISDQGKAELILVLGGQAQLVGVLTQKEAIESINTFTALDHLKDFSTLALRQELEMWKSRARCCADTMSRTGMELLNSCPRGRAVEALMNDDMKWFFKEQAQDEADWDEIERERDQAKADLLKSEEDYLRIKKLLVDLARESNELIDEAHDRINTTPGSVPDYFDEQEEIVKLLIKQVKKETK